MIRKYTFGTPLPTGAVVQPVSAESGDIPYFAVSRGEDGGVSFALPLGEDEVIFGLGQAVRGMDKRGHKYESWNSDVFNHTETQPSLYGSHNFLVFFSPERLLGIFLDNPGKIVWDLGYTCRDRAVVTSVNGNLDVYLVEGDSLAGIARAFLRRVAAIGKHDHGMALGLGDEDVAAQEIRAFLGVGIIGEFLEGPGRHEDAGLVGRAEGADRDSGVIHADPDEGGAIRFHVLRHLGNIEAVLLGVIVQGVALVLVITDVLVVAGCLHTAGNPFPRLGALGEKQYPPLGVGIPGLSGNLLAGLIPGSAAVGLAVFIDPGRSDLHRHIQYLLSK